MSFYLMKVVKNISLLIAGSLLLLHSFIPHDHHSELNDEEHLVQHQSADNLFDLLKLAFHLDLGGEHLEEYQTSIFTFSSIGYDGNNNWIEPAVGFFRENKELDQSVFFNSFDETQLVRFRGPPHHV